MNANPYAGSPSRAPGRQADPQRDLALGDPVMRDMRPMLASWFAHDLSAWERRTGRRAAIIAIDRDGGDRGAPKWSVDGKPISPHDLSDVVYGRMTLDQIPGAMA